MARSSAPPVSLSSSSYFFYESRGVPSRNPLGFWSHVQAVTRFVHADAVNVDAASVEEGAALSSSAGGRTVSLLRASMLSVADEKSALSGVSREFMGTGSNSGASLCMRRSRRSAAGRWKPVDAA